MSAGAPPSESDPRRALVERVLGSRAFQRSKRLADLLRYIVDRSLDAPMAVLEDADIVRDVFGRDDAEAGGNLLRVQASLLRKKLHEYFAGEGAREPTVIEVALATYRPVFRERVLEDQRDPDAAVRRAWSWVAALGAACVILSAACLWLLKGAPPRATVSDPSVQELWRQMFDNGRPTTVVLADGNMALFQDLLGLQVPLADYSRERMNALVPERITSADLQLVATRMLSQRQAPVADVAFAARAVSLHGRFDRPIEVILARDAAPRHFESMNAILSGPRRANPWLELFEGRLNFATRFDEAARVASFENRAPQAGEAAAYAVEYGVRGFCRVAYLPSGDGAGSVLIVSGTDMSSTEAGADFITRERWVEALRARLGLRAGERVPHFEVLLSATLVGTMGTSTPELVAHRVHAP